MPQIPEYNAPSPGITAPESGVEARAMAGRRIGAFYHQEGANLAGAISGAAREAQDYMDFREISHGSLAEAGLLNDLTDKWQSVISDPNFDPNDPTAVRRFRNDVLEPALDDFSKGFITRKGQEWALSRTERIRDHFFETTTAQTATMSGIAAETNVQRHRTLSSNTAQRDPGATDYLINEAPAQVEAMIPPNTPAAVRARIKSEETYKTQEQIAKSALYSGIVNSPDPKKFVEDMVKRYPQYINGVEADQALKAAEVQARSLEVQQRSALLLKKQQDTLAVEARGNDIFSKGVSVDDRGNVTVTPQAIKAWHDMAGQYPDAPNSASVAKTYIDWAQHQIDRADNPKKIVSDPATKTQLYNGIFDPTQPTTVRDILQAEAQDKLNSRDANVMRQLSKEVAGETDLKTPEMKATLDAAKKILAPWAAGTPVRDAAASEAYATFLQRFVPEYLKEKRAGTLQPNATDLGDSKSLISQTLAPLRTSMQDRLKSMTERNAPQRSGLTGPGETVTGAQIIDIPKDMTPEQAVKQYKSGTKIRLPDGRIGTVP